MISYLELEPFKEIQDKLHCNRRLEVLHQFLRLFIPKQERGADILHLSPINSPSNILILISPNHNSESIDYSVSLVLTYHTLYKNKCYFTSLSFELSRFSSVILSFLSKKPKTPKENLSK